MVEKRHRPKIASGRTYRVRTGCGNIYITPNWDGDCLVEIFAVLGKSGGCASAQLEAITRSISLGLKYGVPVEEFIKELRGIRCPSPGLDEEGKILSCPDAVAGVLEDVCKYNSTNSKSKAVSTKS